MSTKVVINSDSSKCFLIKLHIFSICFCIVLLIFSIYYCLVLPIFSVCLHITVSWYFIEERLLPRDKGWKTYHQRWYVPIRKGLPFTLCLCGWFRRIIFRRVPIQGFESILQVGVQKDFAFAKRKETHLSRDRSLFVMNFTVWNSFVCGMYLQKAMACALTQHIA